MKQVTATGAPTRFEISCDTSTIRSRFAMRADIRSPTFTALDALATPSLSVTRPLRQSSVAADRDGVSRTAQIQTSMRTVLFSFEGSLGKRLR